MGEESGAPGTGGHERGGAVNVGVVGGIGRGGGGVGGEGVGGGGGGWEGGGEGGGGGGGGRPIAHIAGVRATLLTRVRIRTYNARRTRRRHRGWAAP